MGVAWIVLLLALIWPSASYAYLDPGTGSLILHSIVGGIAAGFVVIRIYWHKLKRLFGFSGGVGSADQGTKLEQD